MARTSKTRIGDSNSDAGSRQALAAGGAERQRAEAALAQEQARLSNTIQGGLQAAGAGAERFRANEQAEQKTAFGQSMQQAGMESQMQSQGQQLSPEGQAQLERVRRQMDENLTANASGTGFSFMATPEEGTPTLKERQVAVSEEREKTRARQLEHTIEVWERQAKTASRVREARAAGDTTFMDELKKPYQAMTDALRAIEDNLRAGRPLSKGQQAKLNEVNSSLPPEAGAGADTARNLETVQAARSRADMDFILASDGELPAGFSLTGPQAQEFVNNANAIRQYMGSSTVGQMISGFVKDTAHRDRIINKLAAQATRQGWQPAQDQMTPFGGMPAPAGLGDPNAPQPTAPAPAPGADLNFGPKTL